MNILLDITIKVTAVVLVAFAAAWFWRQRSAAIRHWIGNVRGGFLPAGHARIPP